MNVKPIENSPRSGPLRREARGERAEDVAARPHGLWLDCQFIRRRRPTASRRDAAVLVITAILLPVLLGVTALVIDGGLLMLGSRRAQHAADAAALAAASDLLNGRSATTAQATAVEYVQTHNRLAEAVVTVNMPPSRGPYQGDSSYVEVIVQQPVRTLLIGLLGVATDHQAQRLAVAGARPMNATPYVVLLDPAARPGLSVGGSGTLVVPGNITVNSEGGGVDEDGQPINNGNTGTAASVSNNATVRASDIRVVGGVNNPGNFHHYDTQSGNSPLHAGSLPLPDPFLHLPPPTVSNGANATEYPAVAVTGNANVTLSPGVYPSIRITSGTVVFEPGIYIIRGGDLRVTEDNVTAAGVMFYMTGSDYDVQTGWPDAGDRNHPPPAAGNPSFGEVTINAALEFSGLSDPGSAFDGMLLYQRRLHTKPISIQGNSSAGNLAGTLYAKWATLKIAGQGTYAAQIVAAKMELSGSGNVTIDVGDQTIGSASRVALVE